MIIIDCTIQASYQLRSSWFLTLLLLDNKDYISTILPRCPRVSSSFSLTQAKCPNYYYFARVKNCKAKKTTAPWLKYYYREREFTADRLQYTIRLTRTSIPAARVLCCPSCHQSTPQSKFCFYKPLAPPS